MSKDEKSSPSPNHGLPFDPAHLLGVHSVAAAGLPFPHLTHLPNPYSLLTPPPAFPGLFGGLGSIPHPLHAAALSHSLATASYYGLPKHPSELGPTSPPSSSPSRKGGGRSPRSPASTTTVTSSHRHTVSRSSSSPCTSSAHTVNPVSSYLPSWSLNGSVYPFSHPLPTSDSKQTLSSSSLSSSSRRSRKSSSSKSESRNSSKGSSSKIPPGHQHSVLSPLLSIPSAHLPASLLETKSNRAVGSEGFPFDPHSLITPYHMSPELAYLSHSLFLHRPDLGFASPFLTLSAAAAAAPSSSSTSAGAAPSTSTTTTTSAGLEPSQVVLPLTASSKPSSSSSSSSSLNTTDRSEDTSKKERKQKEFINAKKSEEPSKPDSRKTNDSVGNSSHTVRLDEAELGKDSVEDRLLVDLSQPSHFMDDDRKKQIADQIRKRIGLQDGVAALLSKHGLKHSDWLDSNSEKDARQDEQTTRPELHQTVSSKEMTTSQRVAERSHSPRESLHGQKLTEADNLKLAEQLKIEELISTRKSLSVGDENMPEHLEESANTTHSFGLSEPGESRLDNGMASDNMDMQSSTGSESESERSTSDGCKRAADGSNDEGSPNKKRCLRLDERELTIPLEHGWNRQTIINGMGRRGIVGEVLYFAPCGKKMKTIPDVMRYLERNPNSDLGRENFSFNTKVNVGQFFEIQGAHGTTPVPLSDTEVLERIEMSQGKRARMQMLARKKREKAAREQALARQIMEAKLKRRMELQDWIMKTSTTSTRNGSQWAPTEQLDDMEFANNIALLSHTRNHMQELSRRASEMRFERRLEQQTHKDMEKKERENKVMEKRKEKEQYKMLKQQERVRIQEQLRKEREMRAQQIIEARNRRQKELEEMRLADAVQRNKEREMKRQQLILLKEQERERRRQHLLLVKALEQRKRQEERQHQRQVELEVAMELKKPVEDMELKNAKPLPEYPRLKSRLCGRPISDCMMVVEFLINFGVALNLDKSSLPTLETLERGLLCDSEEDVEDFMSLVMHLLRIAIDDVGVPNPKEAMTKLNQKITEMEMTDSTMSEILRIFVRARGEKEMSEWLSDKPMEALNPTKKAALLAFLCNELLTSKVVTSEIDKHMDAINNLRRDKWLVEGQLRQLRVFQARKFNKIHKSTDRRNTNTSQTSLISVGDDDTMSSSKMESDDDDDKDEDEDKDEEEESGNESDGSSSVTTSASINSNTPFEPVDENTTREESDRKIEKLRKQHAAYRQKVFRASLRLRAINIGQDRYKRTYWILPLTGGVYVEGMESGVPEDYLKEMDLEKENECDEKVDNLKAEIMSEEGIDSKTGDVEKKENNFAKIEKKNEDEKTEQDHSINKKSAECSELSNLKQKDEIKNELRGGSKKIYERASMENGTAGEEENFGVNGARIKQACADIDNTSVLCSDLSADLSAVRTLLQNEVIMEKSLKETVLGVSRPTNGSLRSAFLCDVERDDDDVEDCDDSCVTEVTNIKTHKTSGDKFSNMPGYNATQAKGEISEPSGIKSTQCIECNKQGVVKSDPANRHDSGACPRHTRMTASGCVNSDDVPLLGVASTDVDSHMKPSATVLHFSQEPVVPGAQLKPLKYGKLEARKEALKLGKAPAYPVRDISCEANSSDSAVNPQAKLVSDLVHKQEVMDRAGFSNSKLAPGKMADVAEAIDYVSGSSKRESSGHVRTENDSKYDGTNAGCITKANGEAGVEPDSPCIAGAGKESSLFNKVIFFDKGGKKSDTGDKPSNDNDILRVPQINAGSQETLMSVVSHSVSQAYQGHKQEERSGKLSSSTTADASCLLSSSLLFSAIAKLPQSTAPRQLSPLLSATSLSADTSPSGTDLTPKSKHKQSPLDLTTPLLSSTPIPAHSKTPQPLPPFHPAAQMNSILDLTPPAAHSGHKSSRLSSHPHHSGDITTLPHLPQSPYIPGISHHPYGPCSASETLSSLASIISPPPAHYHPSVAVTTSALLQTPLSPRSTIGLSKTSSSFPSVDAILKGESPFPSSELLQQAASQVLRFAENKKQSSLTTYPTALSALFLSPASSSSSSSLATTTTTTTVTTTALSNVTTDDFLSIYTSPQRSSEAGTKLDAEVVDQSLWFSVLPRLPCDELSLSVLSSYHQQPSPSLSPSVSSYLTPSSSPNKNSMTNHESLLTSLRLLTQPVTLSSSPTFSSTAGLDFVGEFKVPQPPDSNLHSDPWDLLRAAQGKAQPIPKNKQHGWWRIYDLAMLRSIMSCTLGRGIREKNLQRAIHRYLDYAQLHCTYDSEKGETNPHTDTVVGEETEQTNKAQMKKSEAKKNKDKKDTTNCDQERQLNEDADETKPSEESVVCEAGESRVKDEESTADIKIEAHVKLETGDPDDKGSDNKEEKCAGTEECYVVPDLPDQWSVKCMHEIELAALDEVEALEERIFQASLQAKQGWRPHKDADLKLVDRSVRETTDHESYPLDVGISRLLELEANIERRYLKPPLIRSVPLNMTNLSGHSDRSDGEFGCDENIPPGLLLWRQAVAGADSPAQLSLCTQLLAKSISWEKSIMRVTCQICRKDDNEAELLLCDGCDKGYHTYCFKPKMENIPEGDWYCFECVSKVSGTPHCVVCGAPGGKIISCRLCPRYVHLDCIDPPLPRMPKRWQCLNCVMEKGSSKKCKKRKEKLPTVQRITITKLVVKDEPQDDDDDVSDTAGAAASSSGLPCDGHNDEADSKNIGGQSLSEKAPNMDDAGSQPETGKKKRKRKEKETLSPPTPNKKEKMMKKERKMREKKGEEVEKPKESPAEGKKNDKATHKDLLSCGRLLTEMEKHEDGWPFLKPVNKKQFPSYKKYIKCPMDFSTARGRIKTREYKHRQEFAADMRLIFSNCETFNEDDSEVGKAGYALRQFFERRWLELFPDDAVL